MSPTPVSAAFSDDQVQRLTKVTAGQLRYWDQTDFFRPSFASSDYRSSFGRIYSFKDVVSLRVLNALRNQHGVSVQHLRKVRQRLLETSQNAWAGVKLYVLNKQVYWVEPDTQLPQEVASGQYLFHTIDLAKEVEQVEADIHRLSKRDPDKVGQIEKRKSVNQSTAVLAGTRITVRAIQRFSSAGYTVEQILTEYPDLSREDVVAALEYSQAA